MEFRRDGVGRAGPKRGKCSTLQSRKESGRAKAQILEISHQSGCGHDCGRQKCEGNLKGTIQGRRGSALISTPLWPRSGPKTKEPQKDSKEKSAKKKKEQSREKEKTRSKETTKDVSRLSRPTEQRKKGTKNNPHE